MYIKLKITNKNHVLIFEVEVEKRGEENSRQEKSSRLRRLIVRCRRVRERGLRTESIWYFFLLTSHCNNFPFSTSKTMAALVARYSCV
jgi:hypothetical protein